MKKFLLIICLVFLMTGCDVNYNITIDEDIFDENIVLSFSKSNTSYDDISFYPDNKIPVYPTEKDKKFYNSKIVENTDSYDLIYSYKHDFYSLKNSYFINNCYHNMSITESDDRIVIDSGEDFACFIGDDGLRADSLKINVTTKLKVISNNADTVNGNTYTWIINENNYLAKKVSLILEKNDDFSLSDIVLQNDEQASASSMTGIIVIIIVIVSILIYLFVRHKLRKNNDF